MASWDGGPNYDEDEVLNLNLFARKSFGFQGITEEKEIILKKIVTQIGATCDDCPKYTFTSLEHFSSLTDFNTNLYNVTYIRDCLDANRCLSIEHYKLGPKYSNKKEYREFDPCCANFHNGEEACIICDPTFETKMPALKVSRHSRTKSNSISETSATKTNKKNSQSFSLPESTSTDTQLGSSSMRKLPWEPWETRILLDYLICNNLISHAKGPKAYKTMCSEGFLKHRTAESMRVYFRDKLLKNIESYNLPPVILKEFIKLRNLKSTVPVTSSSRRKLKIHLKKARLAKKMKKSSTKDS